MPSGGGIARNIPANMFTTLQVAKMIGVSRDTVKSWRDAGHFPPDDVQQHGKTSVHLYFEDSIELARALKDGFGTLAERAQAFHEMESVRWESDTIGTLDT